MRITYLSHGQGAVQQQCNYYWNGSFNPEFMITGDAGVAAVGLIAQVKSTHRFIFTRVFGRVN